MELYNSLKSTKSISKDDFVKMMTEFFYYTDIGDQNPDNLDLTTYTRPSQIIFQPDNIFKQSMNHYPLILKTFLLNPNKFSEFLDTILEPSLKYFDDTIDIRNSDVYITQCICCVTFHLCKLFTMMGHKTTTTVKDDLYIAAAKHYQIPLGNWLSKLILSLPDDSSLHDATDSNNMLNEMDYLLLMSFVSKELKMEDRPVVKYLSAIKRKWQNIDTRFYSYRIWPHEVLFLLTEYDIGSEDLFDQQVRSKYYTWHEDDDYIGENELIKWNYFIDANDFTKSVFNNDEYTLSEFLDTEYMNVQFTKRQVMACYNDHGDSYTLPFFLMIIYCIGPEYLFDMSRDNRVIINNKVSDVRNDLYNMLYNEDLETDLTFVFAMLFSKKMLTYDDMIKRNSKSLIYGMLPNCRLSNNKNIIYVRKFFKALLTQNYSVFKSNAKYYEFLKGHEADELLKRYRDKCVLTSLLEELKIPTEAYTQIPTLSIRKSVFDDFNQSLLKPEKLSKYPLDSPSPIYRDNEHAIFFKDIIKSLLKLEEKYGYMNYEILENLYEYKDSLYNMFQINLDDYKFTEMSDTPVSLSDSTLRSVDKAQTPNMVKTTDENIFKKKVPIIYKKPDFKIITVSSSNHKKEKKVKIGNAIYNLDEVNFIDDDTIQIVKNKYALQDIKFANQNLLKTLLKHYSRTVEGMMENEYGGSDRIIKIRTYLQNKYPTQTTEIIIHIERDKELETLLSKWNSMSAKSPNVLNTNYYIKYYTMVTDEHGNQVQKFDDGIDQGGLTKNFFTKCAKQLKIRFFKEAYNGSNRYILNADGLNHANFIAALLSTLILKEIYLDFNLSILYLALLMFRVDDISNEEKFLYFLLDIDPESRYNSYLRYCEKTYEYADEDDENYYFAMACDPDAQVNESLKYIYNLDSSGLANFYTFFLFNPKIFYRKFKIINSRIRIYDMDKLISMGKLSKKDLKKRIFDKIMLDNHDDDDEDDDTGVYQYLQDLMINDTKEDYKKLYNDYKKSNLSYFQSDNNKMKIFTDLESSQTFKKNVLMFWTGSSGILSEEYKVIIDPYLGIMPVAHTCFNQIDLPTSDKVMSKDVLFKSFMDIFIGSAEGNFSDT